MKPKFNIGDMVVDEYGNTRLIHEIKITKDWIGFNEKKEPTSWYFEQSFEIYREPRPKVKTYLYAMRHPNDTEYRLSSFYFKNDADFKKRYPAIAWFQKLENICIEVEE